MKRRNWGKESEIMKKDWVLVSLMIFGTIATAVVWGGGLYIFLHFIMKYW